jgi:hypothetical protein
MNNFVKLRILFFYQVKNKELNLKQFCIDLNISHSHKMQNEN